MQQPFEINAPIRSHGAHTPSPIFQPGPVGDSDGPEQALPTDTAAGPQKSSKYSNQIVKTHVATPKGEGWEGTKAAAVPTRARRQAAVFMVNKGMGSNDLMAGGADGEARRGGGWLKTGSK